MQGEIDKALKSKVWLKSGGSIVINQTEALVAIDVNTGRYVGKKTSGRLEDTIVKTNLEAVKEIVRQVRLRDLGGIIVLDFIDMEEKKNRQKVLQAVELELKKDRSPSKALQVSDFGLIIITRKRVKQSLERVLTEPCPYCSGTGVIKSSSTICYEILSEVRKIGPELNGHRLLLRVNPDIARALKEEESAVLQRSASRHRQRRPDQIGRAAASRAVRRHGDLGQAGQAGQVWRVGRDRVRRAGRDPARLSDVSCLPGQPRLPGQPVLRRRQVDQIVCPAPIDPHADVIVTLQLFDLGRARRGLSALRDAVDFRRRNDGRHFACDDLATAQEFDVAFGLRRLAGARLRFLTRQSHLISAGGQRLAVRHHFMRQRNAAE